uniref:EF-hand domain-containing protein n=1 Tax=Arcella intermedia TaxID=1963864 RepID=A0A6B2L1Z0_9EUKA
MDPKAVNLRGAGYCFGEDSVIKFLSNNGLDLVVRSHQLFDEGYMSHFSNRMMTVFSCSYYAGKNTNKGSVLVYANSNRAKPDFWRTPTIHQYYGSVLMKSSKAKNLEEVQKQDSLKKLYELIYDNSHNLKLEFEKFSVDIDSEKKGFVEYLTWESLMTTQLKLNIEWKTLFHYLVPNDAFLLQSGTTYISYAKFLGRYRINLDNRLTEWQDDVTNSLVTYFVVNNTPLEQAFKNYDSNGDGVISYLEFWEALSKHNLGSILTQLQCNELMSTIDINRDGSIDWKEFKQYFHAKFDRFNNASEKIKNIVADLSKQLIPKHKSIKNSFLVFDADHNGRISFQEFQKVLNRDLDAPKDEPTQKELFEYVDENSSGTISYKEFKTAFEGANAEKFSKRQHFEVSAKNIFMYHLCEAIRTSKTKLEALWLPKSKNGIIKGSDFALGLKALNDTLAQQPQLASHQIADEQMKKLQSILEKNGMVDFRSFLKMFEVKLYVPETQPPPKT